MVLVMLELIGGGSEADGRLPRGSAITRRSLPVAYLADAAVEASALYRREATPATVQFLRRALGDGDDGGDGLGGVREPRRPRTAPGGATAPAINGEPAVMGPVVARDRSRATKGRFRDRTT